MLCSVARARSYPLPSLSMATPPVPTNDRLAPRALYAAVEPFAEGMLPVGDGHNIHYEECGNPSGRPICFIHGGPGSSVTTTVRRYFNPEEYRIVVFCQRGAGKSTPFASLESNTTWHLVADMEILREHLHIERWVLFGGSWGSTLALAYAETHPTRVMAMVLRGIFLLRKSEVNWFYNAGGASMLFPDAYADFAALVPLEKRGDMIAAYYELLTDADPIVVAAAARAFSVWEARCTLLVPSPATVAACGSDAFALARSRIECHYFLNGGWLEPEDQLLRNVRVLKDIPAVIVQGRYDVVCPFTSAWELHQAWPEATFIEVPTAGHGIGEPGIQAACIWATDHFATTPL